MLRIPLISDDSFLLLAPQWAGWGETGQTAAVAALLLVPLVLIAALYRYELKLVSRSAALCMLFLRGLGLLVLWALVGLQPTIGHVEKQENPSRVIVTVDLSASMDLADPQRTPAEQTEILKALALSSNEKVKRLTRKDIARRLLLEQQADLLRRLKEQHHVELIGFDRTLVEGAGETPDALFEPAARSASTTGTNVGLPLQRALQPGSAGTGKLLGVVLLTDGQHNQGPPPLPFAAELARQGTPIYPIAIGSKIPPVDLAVLDLKAPKQVFKDAEATVEAKVRATGLPAQTLIVELYGSGKLAKQEKRIQHDGKDRTYTESFPIKLEEVGAQSIEIRVRPGDPNTRETTTENNRLATVVRVAPEKVKLLAIDDEPRWEHHYLAGALSRDKDLQLDQILFNQPRLGALTEENLEKLGNPRRKLPAKVGAGEDPLWQYDCIFLGDVAPEQLPSPDRKRLERYVADRGGTLVILAGKRHMPLAYVATPDDPFGKLLPLRSANAIEPKDGFTFAPTEEGSKSPFFQIEKDIPSSKTRWAEMPKHFWGAAGIPKPGATVLARAASPSLPQPKDPAAEATAIVLHQPYGFGKVLYLGLDSTWRWRYRVGDLYHHRFWGQLARWAVADAWLPEGNRFVRFGSKSPIYHHDQEVELAGRFGQDAPAIASGSARMKLIRAENDKDETAATVPLVQDAERPKQWTAKVKQLPPGRYRVDLDVPELRGKANEPEPKTPAASHGFTVLPPEDPELIDVATNWDLLRSLAETSRGRLFTVEDAAELPDLLARQVVRTETRREERLWRDEPLVWWVLGVLVAIFTCEWILRKAVGLP